MALLLRHGSVVDASGADWPRIYVIAALVLPERIQSTHTHGCALLWLWSCSAPEMGINMGEMGIMTDLLQGGDVGIISYLDQRLCVGCARWPLGLAIGSVQTLLRL